MEEGALLIPVLAGSKVADLACSRVSVSAEGNCPTAQWTISGGW